MNISPEQKRIIEGVIAVIEVGKQHGGYDNVTVLHDGPDKIKQITYGRFQTTEYGNLPQLLKDYVKAGGVYGRELSPYIPMLAAPGRSVLVPNLKFRTLLKDAANKDEIMRDVQDAFFERTYYQPALKWAEANGFKEALSMLVIFDSFIQSGSIKPKIRKRFPEVPPAKGGDERAWIKAYVRERQEWLAEIGWAVTQYRTKCFLEQISKGNWDLSQLPIRVNGALVR